MASQHGALEMVLLEEGEVARDLVERLMSGDEERKEKKSSSVKQEALGLEVTIEEATLHPPIIQQSFPAPLQATVREAPTTSQPPISQESKVTTLTALNALFPAPTPSSASPRPPVLKITELLRCRFPHCTQVREDQQRLSKIPVISGSWYQWGQR